MISTFKGSFISLKKNNMDTKTFPLYTQPFLTNLEPTSRNVAHSQPSGLGTSHPMENTIRPISSAPPFVSNIFDTGSSTKRDPRLTRLISTLKRPYTVSTSEHLTSAIHRTNLSTDELPHSINVAMNRSHSLHANTCTSSTFLPPGSSSHLKPQEATGIDVSVSRRSASLHHGSLSVPVMTSILGAPRVITDTQRSLHRNHKFKNDYDVISMGKNRSLGIRYKSHRKKYV